MKILLVDTDILIDHLRGKEEALSFLKERLEKGDEIYYSTISKVEIYAGIRQKEKEATEKLFSLLNSCPVSDEIAEKAGYLLLKYRRKKNLQIPDAIIAASSIELSCPLISRNVKDYNLSEINVFVPYT